MTMMINENLSLEKCPALVLNADYRPLSYYPLSLWSWQDAIKSVFLDRVSIVSHYDRMIRSPSFSMQLPSVIALKSFIKPRSNPNFTRFNVFLRDKFSCQYCGSNDELTFDHLLPRSKGGKTDWENVVTACSACNVKKGGRLLKNSGMKLNQWPFQPTTEDLHRNGKNFPPNFLHSSWMDYLYWDVELDPS
jgi:5-methylcytosine-specific restriction endonuclease McrA